MLVLAGVEVRPAEIAEQRPRPVGGYRLSLAEIESALRPLIHRRAIVRHGESAHVSSVSGEVVLARITRTREGCFEQRQSPFRIAAGAQLPTTLEVDAHLRDGARSDLRFRLLEQAIASVEVVP